MIEEKIKVIRRKLVFAYNELGRKMNEIDIMLQELKESLELKGGKNGKSN